MIVQDEMSSAAPNVEFVFPMFGYCLAQVRIVERVDKCSLMSKLISSGRFVVLIIEFVEALS